MSAGTGIMHSEFNASETAPVHFLQIWIIPDARGIQPSYEQKHFAPETRRGKITLLAGKGGRENALTIHQDADLYSALLAGGDEVSHAVKPGRKIWVQVAQGAVTVNGTALKAGDGAALAEEAYVHLHAEAASDVLIFDMA